MDATLGRMGPYGRALFSGIVTMLSDSESDVGSLNIQLTVNEHFAKAYAAKKEREELDKCMWINLQSCCMLTVI